MMGDDEFGQGTTTTMKHSQHSAPNRRLSLIATTSGLACGVLCATSFTLGLAQEPKPIQPRLRDMVEAERSPQDEMLELFHAVERRMQDMGSYLLDASAGDTSRLGDMQESGLGDLIAAARPQRLAAGGIADLLSATHGEGSRVLEDIDRILEIAAEQGGT
ncbi:MAG: hypothetical protein CMJ61_04990 [Planctomycetaceae bacterium]|nr:hypothetical protein [Planctomycetaceae bacterium]